MGKRVGHHNGMKKKGEAGAAKNYITRTQAIKKLQCTLADFRRLCILKGIYPREPRNRKKANKGSSAPASFYYTKDIQYLLHEPILGKLREHKAFAKKLSKAVGRKEWGLAKNLESSKPTYRLDHVIKERYPTFLDSLRDLDDALSLIVLFAALPSSPQIPAAITANCAKLAAEWQLYVMRTKSLRKVFLSIKGVYFQAEVHGVMVTWLVPYMFTQNIPSDLDFRIMLTFLELYQTLLGFVFFRLFSDINLVYPPRLDKELEEGAAGIGALLIEESAGLVVPQTAENMEDQERRKVNAKEVRKQIKELSGANPGAAVTITVAEDGSAVPVATEEAADLDVFLAPEGADHLPQPDLSTSSAAGSSLFANYHFYISREVTRPTLEFVLRSFGAASVSWDAVLGAGSPYKVDDKRITHHIIDRPGPLPVLPEGAAKRSYIQPQWVVDCANKGILLPTEVYKPGTTLPPHLSPFVDVAKVREEGGYVPAEAGGDIALDDEEEEVSDDDDVDEEEVELELDEEEADEYAAELAAESRGVSSKDFQAATAKKAKATGGVKDAEARKKREEKEANDAKAMLLSGKQRKLYKKMAFTKEKNEGQRTKLEERKKALLKAEKKQKKGKL